MSKSLKNYPDPEELLNKYGGDSLRAYLINSPVVRGEPLKFSEEGVKLVTKNVILPLWNSFSFFSNYANADNISMQDLTKASPVNERSLMDQWIVSSLQSLIKTVNEKMENYYLYEVIPPLIDFIDELTNWYVRTNRKRFWKEKDVNDIDKLNAFKTLHEILLEFSKTMAPVLPFLCEEIYQGLTNQDNNSIHLESYPEADTDVINKELERQVKIAKNIIRSGRNVRLNLNLPNKQPLQKISIVSNNLSLVEDIEAVKEIILDELNIKDIEYINEVEEWYKYECKPDFPKLGPMMGKDIVNFSTFLQSLSQKEIKAIIDKQTLIFNDYEVSLSELDLRIVRENLSESHEIVDNFSINLDTEITEELYFERISREIVSVVQNQRKELGFDITDRIKLEIVSNDIKALKGVEMFQDYICKETLTKEFKITQKEGRKAILDFSLDTNIDRLTDES